MAGLGTIINMAGILAGGLGGLLFGNRLEKRYQDTLLSANGICVLFLGISGCLQEMFTIADGKISSGKTMMMIGSFAIGGLIGEWMNIEMRMEQFGEWLKKNEKRPGYRICGWLCHGHPDDLYRRNGCRRCNSGRYFRRLLGTDGKGRAGSDYYLCNDGSHG